MAQLSWPASAPYAKRFNPNRVASNFAGEIEFSAAQFVECFNLESLPDGSRESAFGVAMHARY